MPAQTSVSSPTESGHALPRHAAIRASIRKARNASAPARRSEAAGASGRADRRSRAALGNNAKTAATAGQGSDQGGRRAERYRARAWLSTVTALPRVSKCGRVSVLDGSEVALKITTAESGVSAGYGGLSTCGSVWACPVCSAKIAARRTQEIESLLAWNAARNGSVALVTFTMRHHSGHRLKALRKALSVAWRHLTASRAWKETRKREGCDGYVRSIECTYGENGWHLHIHLLTLFDGPVSQEMVSEWSDELYELWSAGLAKSGMEASREHGVDVRLGKGALDGLGKYLAKLTFETAGGRFKKGRKGGRTPFELLDDAINTGLASDFDAWFEWEQASKGMRQITWSRGLKAAVGVDETTDEEIAEEDQTGETVAMITPAGWKVLYWQAAELLTIMEQGGPQVAFAWMDRRGITFEVSKALDSPE
jgi:hypothetical protein